MNTLLHLPAPTATHHFATDVPASIESDDAKTEDEQKPATRTAKAALLVIEDHASLLDGLIPLLEADYEVSVVRNTNELKRELAQKNFTLATVDLTLDRRLEGLDMMPLLRQAGVTFLVFSGTAQEWHIRAAMRLGASGYVDKREKLITLLDALATIAAGNFIYPEEFLTNLKERKDQHFPQLARAEFAAMDAIFSRLNPANIRMPPNKEIADARKVGIRRIENLIRDLVGKFELRDTSREALLAELLARGYYPGASLDSFQELGVFDVSRRNAIKKPRK